MFTQDFLNKTCRFSPPTEWNKNRNNNLLSLLKLIGFLDENLPNDKLKMCELGTFYGESTFLFASSQIFAKIYIIDSLKEDEYLIDLFDVDIESVLKTRTELLSLYNNIEFIQSDMLDYLKQNKDFDFVYLDANKNLIDVLEEIKNDVDVIGGDDWDFKIVRNSVFRVLGNNIKVFNEKEWIWVR